MYAGASPTGGSGGFGRGLHKAMPKKEQIGRAIVQWDERKFGHDRFAARAGNPVFWHVSKDDRMTATEAGRWLNRIHEMYGVQREEPEIVEAFNNSLFFCHTVNSGSTLQPARSTLTIKGTEFPFIHVVEVLGNDIRRFFRAYADDVKEVNQSVLDNYDPNDWVSKEKHSWLVQVAAERNLLRYPHLAHDSSDKCLMLTPVEQAALAASKAGVFANIVNMADRTHANARVLTIEDDAMVKNSSNSAATAAGRV